MLVKHLIEELQKCNPEAEVITEGCDCQGDSAYVSIDDEATVCINRETYKRHGVEHYNNRSEPEIRL